VGEVELGDVELNNMIVIIIVIIVMLGLRGRVDGD